ARTGVTDLLSPTGVDEASWTDAVLGAPTPTGGAGGVDSTSTESAAASGDATASRNATAGDDAAFDPAGDATSETASVEVGHAADRAATRVHDGLGSIVRASHRVEATVETETTQVADGGHVTPDRPRSLRDEPWRRVDTSRTERVRVTGGSDLRTG
ncbi:hypothetical protein EXE52_18115, partial [Halorubrum sp. CGM4_25_10-8A]